MGDADFPDLMKLKLDSLIDAPPLPWRCFTVTYAGRKLHLVALSDESAMTWCLGLQELRAKAGASGGKQPLTCLPESTLLWKRARMRLENDAAAANTSSRACLANAIRRASLSATEPPPVPP